MDGKARYSVPFGPSISRLGGAAAGRRHGSCWGRAGWAAGEGFGGELEKGRGPRMYEMQGPRSVVPHLASRLLDCPALPDRPPLPDTRPKFRSPGSPAVSRSCPRDRYPSLVVNEFVQRHADLAQGVSRTNFKILCPSTGHLKLSPALRWISTELSTASSTTRGIRGRGDERDVPARYRAGTSAPRGARQRPALPWVGETGTSALGGGARQSSSGWRASVVVRGGARQLLSSSRRPKLPNSRWPAPAAVSATPRTAPMSGSADRFHESW